MIEMPYGVLQSNLGFKKVQSLPVFIWNPIRNLFYTKKDILDPDTPDVSPDTPDVVPDVEPDVEPDLLVGLYPRNGEMK